MIPVSGLFSSALLPRRAGPEPPTSPIAPGDGDRNSQSSPPGPTPASPISRSPNLRPMFPPAFRPATSTPDASHARTPTDENLVLRSGDVERVIPPARLASTVPLGSDLPRRDPALKFVELRRPSPLDPANCSELPSATSNKAACGKLLASVIAAAISWQSAVGSLPASRRELIWDSRESNRFSPCSRSRALSMISDFSSISASTIPNATKSFGTFQISGFTCR